MRFQAVLLRQEDTDDAAHALQPGQPDADQTTAVQHNGNLPHSQYR